MSHLKTFAAFALGSIFIIFCYYKVNLPFIPAIGVSIAGEFLSDGNSLGTRKLLILLLGISSTLLYGFNAYYYIVSGEKLLWILFEVVTTLTFIGSTIYELLINVKANQDHFQ